MAEWSTSDAAYELIVEPEIYWRLGGPVKKPKGGAK